MSLTIIKSLSRKDGKFPIKNAVAEAMNRNLYRVLEMPEGLSPELAQQAQQSADMGAVLRA